MWHCNLGFPFAHGPLGLLLYGVLGAVVLLMVLQIGRALFSREGTNRDACDSLEIIKARYARGEISEEEYQRMREILTR